MKVSKNKLFFLNANRLKAKKKYIIELETIRKSEYFEKDREILENLDKITNFKKRLNTINSKMEKIQTRVDKIEQRYLKHHSDMQKMGESQKK